MTYQQSGSSFYHQVIVGAGADVTVRARGTFFHPADQQNSSPPQDSNYEVSMIMETIVWQKLEGWLDFWAILSIQFILDRLDHYGPFWATLDHKHLKHKHSNTQKLKALKILSAPFSRILCMNYNLGRHSMIKTLFRALLIWENILLRGPRVSAMKQSIICLLRREQIQIIRSVEPIITI